MITDFPPPPCHVERPTPFVIPSVVEYSAPPLRLRRISAALAACAFGRIYEMSPRANAWST